MTKPTKRVRVSVTIEYQMTENRAERVRSVLSGIVAALRNSPYPYEYLSPSKGDFVDIKFSEPKGVR